MIYYLTVAVLSLLAVMVLREIRAELWDRSIEREREADWCRHMRDVHSRWRTERIVTFKASSLVREGQMVSLREDGTVGPAMDGESAEGY